MLSFFLLISVLVPFQVHRTKVYEAPVDDVYLLRAEASYFPKDPGSCCTSLLRVLLVDRTNANRYWEIAAIPEEYEYTYTVRRADRSSVVIDRTQPDYGIHYGSLKLFFDSRSKRLLKKVEFRPLEAIKSVSDQEAQRVGLDSALFEQIKNFDSTVNPDPLELPPPLRNQPLPQSTYRDFARARPKRVRDGYVERGTTIEEKIGPYEILDGRIWFGKTFYDGEGTTGVGALSYFDITQQKFTFLNIPEVVEWSVSAILVEGETLWAGLQNNPEGASRSGGLLRHDLKTSSTRIYAIEDLIRNIYRVRNALLIGTSNGVYVLTDGRLVRHRAATPGRPWRPGERVPHESRLQPEPYAPNRTIAVSRLAEGGGRIRLPERRSLPPAQEAA